MNKQQSNHYRMFLNTQSYLDNHTSTWSAINRIGDYKNDMDELISRIAEKSDEAALPSSVSERKNALREALAVKVAALSGALQAYAHDSNNPDLAGKVKATYSDIKLMKEQDLAPFIKTITTEANNNLEALADFGVTENSITEVLTTLDDFNALIGMPRSILNSKYVMLDTIEKLFDECNALLKNKLDNIILMFVESNPDFYNGYQRARTIVDI